MPKRTTHLTPEQERTLLRAGVPLQHEAARHAVDHLVDDVARDAKVSLLRWMARQIFTYEHPPPGPWWRRWAFYINQGAVRDNYTRQAQLNRLADEIENHAHRHH